MADDLVTRLAARHPARAIEAVAALLQQSPGTSSPAPAPEFITAIAAWSHGHQRPAPVPAWLWATTADLTAHAWRRNPGYSDPAFLERYAYTELVGPHGRIPHTEVSFGLLALAPHTLYPAHAHPAVESYVVLLGTADWCAGDAPWTPRPPGSLVHHPSGIAHAMRTADEPLVAAFFWTGALDTPARILPAPPAS
jgi:quercetin dioxygenase-like cupin family protein